MLRVDREEAGNRGTPPSFYHPCVRPHYATNLEARATLHDYHLDGDEVNAHSGAVQCAQKGDRGLARSPAGKLSESSSALRAKRCNRCAHQLPYMGLTLRILDLQGACSTIAGQSLLFSAKFGVEVAPRQLKQRICRVFFCEWCENVERFLILLIVAVQI